MDTLWTTFDDIKSQVQRLWDKGDLLRSVLGEGLDFPLRLRLKKPRSTELADRFAEVRQWIGELQAAEGAFRIEWKSIQHRQLGHNQLPDALCIDSLADALKLIGKQAQYARFCALAASTSAAFSVLKDWLRQYPLRLLEQEEDWPQILEVLRWFAVNPNSGLYLRQIDIAGVDSKFIEQRRGLLAELLDKVLGEKVAQPELRGTQNFAQRFGLRDKPLRARLRFLDRALSIQGMQDIELPMEQMAALQLPVQRVFICENEINFLAFPEQSASVVFFGQGYALDKLAQIDWLYRLPLYYWGDIDSHGFAILSRLRGHLPQVKSLLMDRETLMAHRTLWGTEPADKRCRADLLHLNNEEAALYADLRFDRLIHKNGQTAHSVRLEQEHIRFSALQQALKLLD